MAVRLRLRRMGRKKRPFYRIVAVDSRVKRDGKYLDSIGYYNPLPDPFELQIDTDRALYWLKQGAQPSDTVRSLFRRKGIMLRWHLIRHGKSEEEIEAEVRKWEELQQEKMKKLEAARIQKMRQQKPEPEPTKTDKVSESLAEAAEQEAQAETETTEVTSADHSKAKAQAPAESESGVEASEGKQEE